MRRPTIALALGSGAFRGLAHIGVLDTFEREGIPVDMIAGTSMGALVGAIYAAGVTPKEMEARLESLNEMYLYDVTIPRRGLLSGRRAQALVEEMTGAKTFEQARLPFAAVACDFATGERVVLREGPMHEAVRASTSIPGVFVPVERDGRTLVDGGLVGRVPSDVCHEMGADLVIGVDVGYRGQHMETGGIIEILIHTIDIFEWQVAKQHVSEADLMITPNVLDFNPARIGGRGLECVQRGRDAALQALREVRRLIDGWAERTG